MEIAFSAQQQQQHWIMKVTEPELQTVYTMYTTLVRSLIRLTVHPSIHPFMTRCVLWLFASKPNEANSTKIRIHFDQNHFPSFCIWSTNKQKKLCIHILQQQKSVFSVKFANLHTRSHFSYIIFVHKILWIFAIATGNINYAYHNKALSLSLYVTYAVHDPFFLIVEVTKTK